MNERKIFADVLITIIKHFEEEYPTLHYKLIERDDLYFEVSVTDEKGVFCSSKFNIYDHVPCICKWIKIDSDNLL